MEEDEKRKEGDLTSIGQSVDEEGAFTLSPESDALPALEGLGDLLEPLSPTSLNTEPHTSGAPFDSLPPIDPEIQNLADEAEAMAPMPIDASDELHLDDPVPAAPFPEFSAAAATPVGAAIGDALQDSSPTAKHYSEHVAPSAGPALAATPFSLRIEGPLRIHEREALLQILSRENLGIREVELEPQFTSNTILIPRISEFAGIQIVQALRNSHARMRLGPSDRIFSAKQSHDDDDRLIYPPNPDAEILITEDGGNRADSVLLTSDAELAGKPVVQAMDVLHGSMNLKAAHVAQPQSPVFQDAIERLKRQLKFQALHRGANALLGFHYELHPLEGQTIYKLVVQARAVRVEGD